MSAGNQCAHEPCRCYVDKPGEFCSAHCRQAAASGSVESPCVCGHPACDGRTEEDLDGA